MNTSATSWNFHDGRFARYRRFPLFAFNTLQRMSTLGSAKVFVRQYHDGAGLTAAQIHAVLKERDTTLWR